MLEGLFGSDDAVRILLFLAERKRGYGREIATFWGSNVSGIQRQLDKLEAGGVIVAEDYGRMRIYAWNPRWPFREELQALLTKGVSYMPEKDRERLQLNRRRPRRREKPL